MKKIVLHFITACVFCVTAATAFATDALENAWGNFYNKDYQGAINAAKNTNTTQARYLMGLSYIKLGESEKAREQFNFILKNDPDSPIKEEVSLSIADSYSAQKDSANAIAAYEDFIKKFPESGMVSLARARSDECQKGQCPSVLTQEEASCYIQVGAFSKKENANRLSQKLNGKSFNAYIKTGSSNKTRKSLYKVCVGQFQNAGEAGAAARKLKSGGYSVKICE